MSFIFYQNVLSQLVIIYFKLLQIEILQLLAVHNSCHFLILFMNVVDYYCTIKYYQGRITQYNRILGFRSYYFPYVHSLYINCDLGIYFLSEFFHEFGEIVDLFIVFFIHIQVYQCNYALFILQNLKISLIWAKESLVFRIVAIFSSRLLYFH